MDELPKMIPTYTLNSTQALNSLDILGARCGTDKSPFNQQGHRHPYTPFYASLLQARRHLPLRFAEIGVAGGASVLMWGQYFTQAEMYFYDRDENFLKHAADFQLPRTHFALMDVEIAESIRAGLTGAGGQFDVILDDSSHNLEHQKIIIPNALDQLKPGGLLLVEDIFRNIPNAEYYHLIEPLIPQLGFFAFYEMEHTNKYSPGWDNDKLLLLQKAY
jgi:SAM-dependent methyltransferase